MFTRFEEQWHCCGGARLGGAMQTFLQPYDLGRDLAATRGARACGALEERLQP